MSEDLPTYDPGPPDLPIKACLWRILVEPKRPKEKSEGGILLAPTTMDAEEAFTCVARVVHVGSQAYQSKPQPGIDFALEPHKAKVGSWVLFARHSGQRVKMVDGREYRFLNDTDILGVVSDPEGVVAYV